MFSLICVWINGWVNNREAGDWRRYRTHYDVRVMSNLTFQGRCIIIKYKYTYLSPNKTNTQRVNCEGKILGHVLVGTEVELIIHTARRQYNCSVSYLILQVNSHVLLLVWIVITRWNMLLWHSEPIEDEELKKVCYTNIKQFQLQNIYGQRFGYSPSFDVSVFGPSFQIRVWAYYLGSPYIKLTLFMNGNLEGYFNLSKWLWFRMVERNHCFCSLYLIWSRIMFPVHR